VSANATGTPTTNFSIPKHNTPSDSPNGKGINEMMDAIDTLLANAAQVVTRPAAIASGEVPVYNGTTFVRSSSVRINNGGQSLPIITTSALSGGPPGSPNDADVWVATGVDGAGARWAFQYNAGSGSSSKWEFIGGSPLTANIATDESTGSTGWLDLATAGPKVTITRAGDYLCSATAGLWQTTSTTMQMGVTAGTGTPAFPLLQIGSAAVHWPANQILPLSITAQPLTGVGASTDIRLRYNFGAATGHALNRTIAVYPIRIA
jgi:hypothetical protein